MSAGGCTQVRWREGARGAQRARRFRRKVDAEAFRTEIEHALLRGTYVPINAGRIKVADWWARWSPTQVQWAPGTRTRHTTMWALHIAPVIGRRELADVRASDLQRVIAGSGLAASTCAFLRSTVSSMFAAAVADRLIAMSPAVGLKVPKDDRSEPRPLSDDELTVLIDVCTDWERAWVLLGVGTGVRISEGLAVRLDTVNFLGRELTIANQARTPDAGPAELAPTKNRTPRSVPLSDSLVKVLAHHVEVHGVGDHGALFPGPSGALWKRAAAGRRFASIVKRAGLEQSITWHNLRDTAATNMLRDGLSPMFVAKVIGNTVPVLLERYAGVLPDDTERGRAALERITARLVAV